MITMLSIISDEETNYIYGCAFHAYAYTMLVTYILCNMKT